LEEEQVLARDMVIQMPHTLREDYTSIGSPIKLSKTPVEYKKAPPCLGEDTDAILIQFLSADEIEEFKNKKVIQQR
jgi:crotonobetainyl-CoA:carnitine CoA-transferase CaiB-like acyl-CoA transferase